MIESVKKAVLSTQDPELSGFPNRIPNQIKSNQNFIFLFITLQPDNDRYYKHTAIEQHYIFVLNIQMMT